MQHMFTFPTYHVSLRMCYQVQELKLGKLVLNLLLDPFIVLERMFKQCSDDTG